MTSSPPQVVGIKASLRKGENMTDGGQKETGLGKIFRKFSRKPVEIPVPLGATETQMKNEVKLDPDHFQINYQDGAVAKGYDTNLRAIKEGLLTPEERKRAVELDEQVISCSGTSEEVLLAMTKLIEQAQQQPLRTGITPETPHDFIGLTIARTGIQIVGPADFDHKTVHLDPLNIDPDTKYAKPQLDEKDTLMRTEVLGIQEFSDGKVLLAVLTPRIEMANLPIAADLPREDRTAHEKVIQLITDQVDGRIDKVTEILEFPMESTGKEQVKNALKQGCVIGMSNPDMNNDGMKHAERVWMMDRIPSDRQNTTDKFSRVYFVSLGKEQLPAYFSTIVVPEKFAKGLPEIPISK